jgi:predicted small lipoprotein YifL
MKRLTFLLAVTTSLLLFSACGQSGPLYIPGNPSQMAVPPSRDTTINEEPKEDEQDTGDSSEPEQR